MSVIHIRNLADAPQHVEEVSRWLWEQWARADGYSLEDIVYRTRHAMGRRGVPQMLVAEEDGAPVGVVSLWHNDAKTRQDLTPWLAALYIRPDCRGQHIGRQRPRIISADAPAVADRVQYGIGFHKRILDVSAAKNIPQNPTGHAECDSLFRACRSARLSPSCFTSSFSPLSLRQSNEKRVKVRHGSFFRGEQVLRTCCAQYFMELLRQNRLHMLPGMPDQACRRN